MNELKEIITRLSKCDGNTGNVPEYRDDSESWTRDNAVFARSLLDSTPIDDSWLDGLGAITLAGSHCWLNVGVDPYRVGLAWHGNMLTIDQEGVSIDVPCATRGQLTALLFALGVFDGN